VSTHEDSEPAIMIAMRHSDIDDLNDRARAIRRRAPAYVDRREGG
jgi:hypothetical protein